MRGTSGILALALTGALTSTVLAGCGGAQQRGSELRPPSAILLSAAITPTRVDVSPAATGAGPITVVVTNLTGRSQQVTFESADTASGREVRQTTAPINPRDTATLKADVEPGTYRMRVGGGAVTPATISVGAHRPSAQDELMLP